MGETIGYFVWFLGEVAFRWMPATLIALTQVGDSGLGTPPPLQPITAPVTTSDVANYFAQAADPAIYGALYESWRTYTSFISIVCLALAGVLIYSIIRLRQVRHMEHQKFMATAHTVSARDLPKTQLRWNHVLEQVGSDSEQNWRLAILEADIMLNELLDTQGYKGETMGDKMRQVDRSSFNTIDIAWEAHRVRNRIAHEGMSHFMNAREVRRVIGLYERVFREFRIIQ